MRTPEQNYANTYYHTVIKPKRYEQNKELIEARQARKLARQKERADGKQRKIDAKEAQTQKRIQEAKDQAKVCSTCKEVKTYAEFGFNALRYDGLHFMCKICSAIKSSNRVSKKTDELPSQKEIKQSLKLIQTPVKGFSPGPMAAAAHQKLLNIDPVSDQLIKINDNMEKLALWLNNLQDRLHRLEK